MWLPILLITVAFTNVMADIQSDFNDCVKVLGVDKIEDLKEVQSVPQTLNEFCPLYLGLFDCVENVIWQHFGLTIQVLAFFLQGDAAKGISLYMNTRSTLDELCDSDSQLHKDVMEIEKCFIQDSSEGKQCKQEAEDIYKIVKALENETQEAAGQNPSEDNRECMLASYEAACVGVEIHEKCGQKAFDTYREIAKKTSVFKFGFCSEDQLMLVKDKFLDALDLSGADRDFYSLAFDLKKKRRK